MALPSKRKSKAEESRQRHEAELLRLSASIDPAHPPVTVEMLRSGAVPTPALEKLAREGCEPARELLQQMLFFEADPAHARFIVRRRYLEDEIRSKAAKALIALSDPFVIPTLRSWLKAAADAKKGEIVYLSNFALQYAIDGVGKARDVASAPSLERLMTSRLTDDYERHKILLALSALSLPSSKAILRKNLAKQEPGDYQGCQIAAALARLGDPAGRDYLLAALDAHVANIRAGQHWSSYVRRFIDYVGDPVLLVEVRARAKAEPPLGERGTFEDIAALVAVTAMSDDELRAMASQRDPKRIVEQRHAIRIIGLRGGPEFLPLLEKLRRFREHREPAYNEMCTEAAEEALTVAHFRLGAAAQ